MANSVIYDHVTTKVNITVKSWVSTKAGIKFWC